MRKRSLSRELALQILYQIDITRDPVDIAWDKFWKFNQDTGADEDIKMFSRDLVNGVVQNLSEIDGKIAGYAANWELERMAVVDRNVLRIGAFELIYRQDIPPKVSINEAVELAKKFSGLAAGKFVNGILDKIKQENKK